MSTSTSSADSLLTPSGLRVSRRELLLLLTSTLRSLGCERAVAALTDEGGVSGSYVRVESLLEHVREGRWAAARRKLNGLRIRALSTQQRRRLRLLLFAANFMEELQRDISQHAPPVKALQLLQRRIQPLHQQLQRVNGTFSSSSPPASSFPSPSSSSSSSSLFSWSAVVSAALGDASVNVSVVDRLSCVLLLSDVSALQEHSGWDSTGRSRRALAERIAAWMPQEAAVAPHRLLELIDVALRVSSSAACPLHQPASASVASLFQRQHHRCSISAPSSSLAELLGHSDEVLHVRWSNSRRMLASVSKDQTCIVWKEREENASASSSASFVLQRVLRGHPAPLWMVEWSSDDAMLLCCGSSSDVSVWWVNSGDLRLRCDSGHREPVHSAAFVLGDRAFVTASSDRWVVMRDLQGAELMRWPVELLTDLHVTADQRILLASSHNGTLEAIDVHSRQHRIAHILPLHAHAHAHAHTHQSIAAFDLASDGSRALITATKPPELLSFDLSPLLSAVSAASSSTSSSSSVFHCSAPPPPSTPSLMAASPPAFPPPAPSTSPSSSSTVPTPSTAPPLLLGRVCGFVQSRYVLRPCYVDASRTLGCVGSEDCSVRLFHLASASHLHSYTGHTGTVNAVASAIERGLLATASDDRTVRIWSIPTIHSEQQQQRNGTEAEEAEDEDETVESEENIDLSSDETRE